MMADDSEEKPSTLRDFSNAKAAIYDTFDKWQKWREEQLQEFRNRQLLESQRLLQLSSEREKQFEQLFKNEKKCSESEESPKTLVPACSDESLINDFNNFDSLRDHSLTGHLQRCFDDSSQSNPNKIPSVVEKIPVFSEIRNPQFSTKNASEKGEQMAMNDVKNDPSVKPKRPFLKKGVGLLRYMPKSAVSGQLTKTKITPKSNSFPQKKNVHLPQKTLNLKPAIRKTNLPSEHAKHIRFDIPLSDNEGKAEYLTGNDSSPVSKIIRNDDMIISPSPFECSPCNNSDTKSEDASKLENENLNLLKEKKELQEFEMLEDCALNSSFNSESSIVQRVLHGDSNKPLHSTQKNTLRPCTEKVTPVHKEILKKSSENTNDKIGLSKCIEEVQARKQMLQNVISDINPRIQSLEREINHREQETLDDSDANERCSTPIENLSLEQKMPTFPLPEDDSSRGSLDIQDYPANFADDLENDIQEEVYQHDYKSCNIDSVLNSCRNQENVGNEEDESVSEAPNALQRKKEILEGKSRLHEKLIELEKEIETYQQLNANLSSMCKERDEILRKLQKERDDFNKNKEAEKKKLEDEIQEERRQIKRQKETFLRYQKLRNDHPTRKEREEMNALRQEVEKLQEELKRQKIKYTSDSRRWKSRIEAAERERDSFKLENIRLEEQCQDLLAALKARIKKKPESNSSNDEDNIQENIIKDISKDVATQTQADVKDSIEIVSKCADTKTTRTEVHYNFSKHDKNERCLSEDNGNKTKDNCPDANCSAEKNNITYNNSNTAKQVSKDVESDNLSVISESAESDFKEIDHGNRIERIFTSGEREIIFHSGTRKVISADGKSVKFLFYNGDVKEIFPDKREVYRYVSGVTETLFPDGLKFTEFPNGQTQRRYPDGQKEIRFPNGTVHNIFPNGSIDIHSADGNVTNLCADGTKIIEFSNGQKEIRTTTYKRREFPDGSVKIIYNSGRQETRYSDGRIKIKDKDGKVLFDTKYCGIPKS